MSMTTFCSSDSLFIDHHFNTDLMTHIGTQDRKLRAVIKEMFLTYSKISAFDLLFQY
ncbi:hypothetical protein T4A_1101 [Trichinella pseudospiralis]|uniref:Uncharacterized protein n=1 Tax=Trichinella pseudospiralis TaxID=6337 RepID=A0A0V1DRD5_TRIPS|nr:hypothetical protein T4A_1101 [Trichinella pseudospiralis]